MDKFKVEIIIFVAVTACLITNFERVPFGRNIPKQQLATPVTSDHFNLWLSLESQSTSILTHFDATGIDHIADAVNPEHELTMFNEPTFL